MTERLTFFEDTSLASELAIQLRKDPGLPVPRSTQSYWQRLPSEQVSIVQSPQLPTETDVVIIGSGITGCSIARQLLSEDSALRIVLVDARAICSGATGRNGGHIKAVPEVSYAELLPSIGKDKAQEVVNFTLENVEELFKVADTLSPEVRKYSEVRRVESLNVFTDERAFARARVAAANFGQDMPRLKSRMRIVEKDELRSKYGIYNAVGGAASMAGAGWPYRLITGILTELLEKHSGRFNIEANTPAEAVDFDSDKEQYIVRTARGSIRSQHLIHATNGHAGHLLPGIRGKLWPMRGQMTAQTPQDSFGVQGGSQSWSIHYGDGFDYITQSGLSGEIFIGGALTRSDPFKELGNPRDDENAVLPTAHLGGIMDATFGRPVRSEVKATWTGIMGFTADGMPLVGNLPKSITGRAGGNEWISAGYNGYGMPNAWLCGKHVADLILGKSVDAQVVPSAYVVSKKRLSAMKPEESARQWLALFGSR